MSEPIRPPAWGHPRLSRRSAVQAGAAGLLGLGMNHLAGLREAEASGRTTPRSAVIYIFLSGGLAQHDSFDPKPEAADTIRGEFEPIATATPGVWICEHLPRLAACSQQWSLVRSLTHPYNDHSDGHLAMLTGRTPQPPTFDRSRPMPQDWPAIASVVTDRVASRNNLPPAVALPERLIHRTGRVIPGQFAGQMGPSRDPWFLEMSPFNGNTYGAYPEYEFHHARGPEQTANLRFEAPNLTLPQELVQGRMGRRLEMLQSLEQQQRWLDTFAPSAALDRHREAAVSLLTSPRVRRAFDISHADEATQQRFGRNSFGWSLLIAARLVEAGVSLVQVNLGNNESWDTHGNAFPNLRDRLLPPTDIAVTALLEELSAKGLLESTLIVMAGEFGRTPRISHLASAYAAPGRDHWGGVQTVWLAGGGIQGGRVIGSSDAIGAYPATEPQTPENFAATIYQSLGIPPTDAWHDAQGRPHFVYNGTPIPGLS